MSRHDFSELQGFKNEGEVIASWGEAKLVKYLDGKLELRDGSKADRIAAREWISFFMHEAVVRESASAGR
jgi:hypothetical protein